MSDYRGGVAWLNMLTADGSQAANKWLHSHASMRWVTERSIRISSLVLNPTHCSNVSDRTFEAAGANCLESASTTGVVSPITFWTWQQVRYLLSTDPDRRGQPTDIGV
jgi:hypothetical protein